MQSIFDLHQAVMDDYASFVRSFIHIADERLRRFVEAKVNEERQFWPEPLLQLSPAYQRDATVEELAQRGLLHAETARIFRRSDGSSYRLYKHQVEAITRALQGESFVLTSGTGSGKTWCYLIPILDAVLRRENVSGPMAFLVYPMNALVNSQYATLVELQKRYEEQSGRRFPVSFVRYTGDTPQDERENFRRQPPHLILTNYVMGELILVRPEDRRLLEVTAKEVPFFLVFDELHTYRGRQGADVAMLVRRWKARLGREQVVHIGTSATLVAHPGATREERRRVVAQFASRFFGTPITAAQVIEETLEPSTQGGPPSPEELRAALGQPLPQPFAELRQHPLARWLEYALGLEPESDGNYRRRHPRPLSEVAQELAEITHEPLDRCQELLWDLLKQATRSRRAGEEPLFAFKLHQFISQGRPVFATLEPPQIRQFSSEGQPLDGKPVFPLSFCRYCGQDYYRVVRLADGTFQPYGEGEELSDEDGQYGYVTFQEDWDERQIPDDWRDEREQIRPLWRARVPQAVWVQADGSFREEEAPGRQKAWWQARRVWLCLRCGEYYTERDSEHRALVRLSSEGRTSATTILATSVLRHAARSGTIRDKLLTFTDSRQDASLQAGHFNDFVHQAVLRSGLYEALKANGRLRFDSVAAETVRRLGLKLADIAREPRLEEQSSAAQETWQTFTELTEYRLYQEIGRGASYIHPNLESLGLLRIEYAGLPEMCARDELWSEVPVLSDGSPDRRLEVVRNVLDYFRKRLAIDVATLKRDYLEKLRRRALEMLNEFWGLDAETELLREAAAFVRGSDLGRLASNFSRVCRLTARSHLGRYLLEELAPPHYEPFLAALLNLLVRQGLMVCSSAGPKSEYYQVSAARMVWCLGEGQPPLPDPWELRAGASANRQNRGNAFFRSFYQHAAQELAALECREHTAQVVDLGAREERERRFRWLPQDVKLVRVARRLPYLVCSPTMELGIDIADLDIVHLRNVPPTPANYAQRSGRTGRQGQPGLILTYCSAGSSHDQYFFHHRVEMVAGAVRAPQLDLGNEALVRSHVQAEWLAQTGVSLHNSIGDVLNTEQFPQLPMRDNLAEQIHLGPKAQGLLRQRLQQILEYDLATLRETDWFSEDWIERVIEEAPQKLDEAFERWRELYRIATDQFRRASEQLMSARTTEEQQRARRSQEEAMRQRNLLLQVEVAREESDFYPYRYLATEGFLPGYNFPALPVRAWVPRGQGEFIARPRALAISEFGPHNIVYHEGAKWQVRRFILTPGGLEQRRLQLKVCRQCGAFSDRKLHDYELCPVCQVLFDGTNSEILSLIELPNVKLQRRERITCQEEERRRLGYRLEVVYQFAPGESGPRLRQADVLVRGEVLFHILYAPTATLFHINHGWRGGSGQFLIELQSGELLTENQFYEQQRRTASSGQSAIGQSSANYQRSALGVRETQNILLVRPATESFLRDVRLQATWQYAWKRAMEQLFQLEDRELGVARVGKDDQRALLFYEAAEGGLGVLRRILTEPQTFNNLAEEALRICHFDLQGNDLKPACGRACYECLLSYGNQLDARLLDRHLVRDILVQLRSCQLALHIQGRTPEQQLDYLRQRCQSEFERQFLDFLTTGNYRLPDEAQKSLVAPRCIADFFYAPNVLVFCDGPPHDHPEQQRLDHKLRTELVERGYRVVVITHRADLASQIERYPEVFRGSA
ncbi:MAG: DEAD/DEAH box helicase [Gemmatales bacterium]|nr:DEAD/DEAH box helicase [Gemmatales bacterium]